MGLNFDLKNRTDFLSSFFVLLDARFINIYIVFGAYMFSSFLFVQFLFWAVQASQPTKKSEIRPRACFFIARLMVLLPDVDVEIPPTSQKIMKN